MGFNPFSDDSENNLEDNPFKDDTPPFEDPQEETIFKFNEETKPTEIMNETKSNIEIPNKKYNIIDMYWLINSKLFSKEKLEENECHIVTIGYNSDFGNLRIGLYSVNKDQKVFFPTGVYKNDATQICTINIFSEFAHLLYNNITKGKDGVHHNFERLFSNEWKATPCMFEVDVKKGTITLNANTNNTTYKFVFQDWQVQTLLNSLKFMINGQSWLSSFITK